jgi:hypothetical protein
MIRTRVENVQWELQDLRKPLCVFNDPQPDNCDLRPPAHVSAALLIPFMVKQDAKLCHNEGAAALCHTTMLEHPAQ